MDISTISDLNQLKAMAYDQIAEKERAENNLQAINSRISQLVTNPPAAAQDQGSDGEDAKE